MSAVLDGSDTYCRIRGATLSPQGSSGESAQSESCGDRIESNRIEPRLHQWFVVRTRGGLDAARKHQLRQLAHLESALGDHLHELVLLLRVGIDLGLAGVEELRRALY